MGYSSDIDYILKENVKILVDWINNGKDPFHNPISIFGTNVILNLRIVKVVKKHFSGCFLFYRKESLISWPLQIQRDGMQVLVW
ncbi:hypothetical protein FSA40_1671 [Streptococcus mutans]|nr:hypothetical protein FSA40_1671 [Streptococcus mutans]